MFNRNKNGLEPVRVLSWEKAVHYAAPAVLMVVALFLATCPVSRADAPAPALWAAVDHRLERIDPGTRQVTMSLAFNPEVQALVIDPRDGSLWTLADQQLVQFDAAGNLQKTFDLKASTSGLGEPKALALDPYDGSLWVGGEKTLLHLTSAGQTLAIWAAPDHFQALTLDADESLWLLSQKQLLHLSAQGTLLASYALPNLTDEPKYIAVDDLGGNLWIAANHTIRQFNLTDLSQPPRAILIPADRANPDGTGQENDAEGAITAMAVDPLLARLWLTTQNQLYLIDATGAVLQTTDLSTVGLPPAQDLVREPVSMSFWLGGQGLLGGFNDSGQWLGNIAVDGEVKALGVMPFSVLPTASLLAPSDGALTNNPRPTLQLSLGASCDGTACSAGSAYLDSLSLETSLNSQDISKLFNVTAGEATYSPPTRLPEGLNTWTAQVKDKFGHDSDQLTAHFTIDTIPPKFLSVSPADGSTLTTAAVTIQGALDDPTASVLLLDASGNVLSLASGASFSFAVTLKPDLNTFTLIAKDPAGNQTTLPLRLTYNAVSITLASPLPNASLDSTTLDVNGNFQGPANTGITVNGVVAMLFGNQFFANLDLDPGVNTLTITATTPEGVVVTKTVNVNVTATAPDPIQVTVEPQSGVAALPVQFTVTNNSSLGIAQIEADFDGNGTTDFSTTDPTTPVAYTYPNPGAYPASIRITDSQGVVHAKTLYVVVNDPAQMDTLFNNLWNGMNQALIRGDTNTALNYLNEGAKRKYGPVFQALLPHMPAIIASFSPLQRSMISEDIGEYAVNNLRDGQNWIFFVYFLRDNDGVWRLDSM